MPLSQPSHPNFGLVPGWAGGCDTLCRRSVVVPKKHIGGSGMLTTTDERLAMTLLLLSAIWMLLWFASWLRKKCGARGSFQGLCTYCQRTLWRLPMLMTPVWAPDPSACRSLGAVTGRILAFGIGVSVIRPSLSFEPVWLEAHAASGLNFGLGLVTLCLWSLLAKQLGFLASGLGRLCVLHGLLHPQLLTCLGRITSPTTGPLIWQVEVTARKRLRCDRTAIDAPDKRCSGPAAIRSVLRRLCLWFLGFSSLPVLIQPGPLCVNWRVCGAAFLLLPSCTAAVQARPSALEPPLRNHPPSECCIELQADYVNSEPGVAPETVCWVRPDPVTGLLHLQEVSPRPASRVSPTWLGATVYTPHFCPVRVAVDCEPESSLLEMLNQVLVAMPDDTHRLMDTCVPTLPQRFTGQATLLRFPSLIHHFPEGRRSAVILDLSSVGGHYFACILPQRMPYEELMSFVTQMVDYSDQPLEIHVANNPDPHREGVSFHLNDGDVVSFGRSPQVWRRKQTARELFADRTGWDSPHEVPTMRPAPGLLVMHGEERFFMPPHHHTGQTPKEAICSMFDHGRDECTLGAFRTPSLEFRGNPCTHVVLASPLPNPLLRGQPHCNRRDIFVLCDFRGIGYNVRVYHSFVHTVHLPSLAALFDYSIPQGQRLAAIGKRPEDDDVPVQAQETLVLYAIPIPAGSQQAYGGERTPSEPDPPGDFEGPPDHAPNTGYSVDCPDTKTRQLQTRSGPYGKPTSRAVSTVLQTRSFLQPFAASVWGCGYGCPWDLGRRKKWLVTGFDHSGLFRHPLRWATALSVALDVPQLTSRSADSPIAPLINQLKLDQEPYSRTPAARAALEVVRDYQLEQGRPWPTLLADDEHAIANAACETSTDEGSGDGAVFTVGILLIEHDIESVQVRLDAPVTVADLLGQLTLRRDQGKRRAFPLLMVVEPQPSDEFGLVIALPGWALHECAVCYDLTEIDGRLFVAIAPVSATREELLNLAALSPGHEVDVYVGNSVEPLLEQTVADIRPGVCIFFIPRFELPGPYYRLAHTLQNPATWAAAPLLPSGPQGRFICAVHESGHRCISLSADTPRVNAEEVAAPFGLDTAGLLLQPVRVQPTDLSMHGRHCQEVYIVSAPEDPYVGGFHAGLFLAVVDCRAMLQGWFAVLHTAAAIPCAEVEETLSTFAPQGWALQVEGFERVNEHFLLQPGLVATASFVPDDFDVHSYEVEEEAPGPMQHLSDGELSSFPDPTLEGPLPNTEAALRDRSRSPRRASPIGDTGDSLPSAWPGAAAGNTTTPGVLDASFFVLALDYAPEVVRVALYQECPVNEALQAVDARRDRTQQLRFPLLTEARPQPISTSAVCVASPAWPDTQFVVIDASRLNGALFCIAVPARCDRETLLATAGFPPLPTVEVYVPDQHMPLLEGQRIQPVTGDCVSLVPVSAPMFSVSSLADRLCDATGWIAEPILPTPAGHWILLLLRTGQHRMLIEPRRRRFIRQDVARLLELPPGHPIQTALFSVQDVADMGAGIQTVLLVDDPPPPAAIALPQAAPDVLYCLDLRPVNCGLAWGRAEQGLVASGDITARCREICPVGFYVVIIGGVPLGRDVGFNIRVQPGEVLVVEFVPDYRPRTMSPCAANADPMDHEDPNPGSGRPLPAPPGPSQLPPASSGRTTTGAPVDLRSSRQTADSAPTRHAGRPKGTPGQGCGFFLLCLAGCTQSAASTSLPRPYLTSSYARLGSSDLVRAKYPVQVLGGPVATPARAGRRPARPPCSQAWFEAVTAQVRALDEAPDVEQLPLITLLEQSASQPDSEAFFLAATLLETLSEVWAEGCRQDADKCRKLRLEEHLPAPSFDIDQDSVSLPHSTDVMRQVLSSWPVTWVFQHFPPAFRLPESTQTSLRNIRAGRISYR